MKRRMKVPRRKRPRRDDCSEDGTPGSAPSDIRDLKTASLLRESPFAVVVEVILPRTGKSNETPKDDAASQSYDEIVRPWSRKLGEGGRTPGLRPLTSRQRCFHGLTDCQGTLSYQT